MPHLTLSKDGKSVYIVADPARPELRAQIAHRIGPDEDAVEIDRAVLVEFARQHWSWRARLRRWFKKILR